jgi:hypothetical protein
MPTNPTEIEMADRPDMRPMLGADKSGLPGGPATIDAAEMAGVAPVITDMTFAATEVAALDRFAADVGGLRS